MSLGLCSAVTSGEELRGLLVVGHEVRSFRPCGGDRDLWVEADRATWQALARAYEQIAEAAYDPVYAEVEGSVSATPADTGFARDYDGRIEIRAIRAVAAPRDTDCAVNARHPESAGTTGYKRTYVLVCEDAARVVVRAERELAWVFLRAGTVRLPAVSADGSAYANGSLSLVFDGELARLGPPGDTRLCRNDGGAAMWEAAKLDGADFRAVGNEPGWILTIEHGARIVLVTDYGATRVERTLPEPQVDHIAGVTRWRAAELDLEVRHGECLDDMSGERFGSRVTVNWRGRTLTGCGRALH
ncbi:MAG: COG3650 family protein [Gammaproteobacteria bacterium]